MKRVVLIFVCAFLWVSIMLSVSSCGKAADGSSSDTGDNIDTATDTEPLRAEDIVYPDESLPCVYITTQDNFQVTSKDEYTSCTFRMELNDRYASYENTFTDEDGGEAQIRCRGNASYTNPEMREKNKYSYKVKLSKKANVLGMGKSKHWYLINNWRDVSNLRHKLAYDLAGSLGLAYTDCTWVNVYYNGEYRGLYLLTESIRVDENRVDTFNWEEFAEDIAEDYATDHEFSEQDAASLGDLLKNDLSWITTSRISFKMTDSKEKTLDFSSYYDKNALDLTTGYFIEYCTSYETDGTKWKTKKTVPLMMDNPKMLHTNPEMYNYVKTFVQDFEDAVCSPTFYNAKGKHYSEYINVDSLVDYWMVWNFLCNNEFGARSIYFYFENGKITFGPIWDFDQTIGNVITVATKDAKGDYWVHDKKNAWFKEIMGDPWFVALAQERWFSIREEIDDLITSVDVYWDYMGDDAERCYERNGVRYYVIRQPEANDGHSLTPTEDYQLIRKWLRERVEWIDENFTRIAPNVDDGGYSRSSSVSCSVFLGDKLLERDIQTVHGAPADYIISPEASGELVLKLSTAHSNARTVDAYLNSTYSLGKKTLTTSTRAEYRIDLSLFDMTEGTKNVIYLPVLKSDGKLRAMSSVVIRVTSMPNPVGEERLVRFGDEVVVSMLGSEITFPEITETREGFVPCGWTSGDDTVYKAGELLTVKDDAYFYVRWKRIDRFSMMNR